MYIKVNISISLQSVTIDHLVATQTTFINIKNNQVCYSICSFYFQKHVSILLCLFQQLEKILILQLCHVSDFREMASRTVGKKWQHASQEGVTLCKNNRYKNADIIHFWRRYLTCNTSLAMKYDIPTNNNLKLILLK